MLSLPPYLSQSHPPTHTRAIHVLYKTHLHYLTSIIQHSKVRITAFRKTDKPTRMPFSTNKQEITVEILCVLCAVLSMCQTERHQRGHTRQSAVARRMAVCVWQMAETKSV
jgi:hypothetical protein